jgi:translation elongation factor EF-Tu-like GTPase
MPVARDVEVEFEVVPARQGGRETPLATGARPQFYYLGQDWDCQMEITEAPAPTGRGRGRAYLAFLSPLEHLRRLEVGAPFLLREGHRVVAFGVVARIIDLADSAQRAAGAPDRYSWHREADA